MIDAKLFRELEHLVKKAAKFHCLYIDEDGYMDTAKALEHGPTSKVVFEVNAILKSSRVIVRSNIWLRSFNGLNFCVEIVDDEQYDDGCSYFSWKHLMYPGHRGLDLMYPLTKDDINVIDKLTLGD